MAGDPTIRSGVIHGLTWSSATDAGMVREINEDSPVATSWPDKSALLIAVADGMGGHNGGEVASALIAEELQELVKQAWPEDDFARYEMLINCIGDANKAVREKSSIDFKLQGMGSTLIAAIVTATQCLHLYAGDCRLYHFRDGECLYMTTDHSVVRVLVETGHITEKDIPTHPLRSKVTSCLGGGQNSQIAIDPQWDEKEGAPQPSLLQLKPCDVLLLCSDGLCGQISKNELHQLVVEHGEEPESLVRACIQAALNSGGNDNITAIAIRIDGQVGVQETLEKQESVVTEKLQVSIDPPPIAEPEELSPEMSRVEQQTPVDPQVGEPEKAPFDTENVANQADE